MTLTIAYNPINETWTVLTINWQGKVAGTVAGFEDRRDAERWIKTSREA